MLFRQVLLGRLLFSNTHRGPLRADLPLTADLQLTGTGGIRPVQVSAAAHVDIEGAVGINLATQDLPMLHAQAAGLAALWPLTNVPAAQVEIKRAWC